MKYTRHAVSCIMVIALAAPLAARSMRISQIETSDLLFRQEVGLYVSITDDAGRPVKTAEAENFTLSESADGKHYTRIPGIETFRSMANNESGITFLLLIDNSGSMYRAMDPGGSDGKRIDNARRAVMTFLAGVSNPKDRVGLALYNAYYSLLSGPTQDRERIREQLSRIERPVDDQGYTEIYGSLFRAVDEFRGIRGRKAIIILSDGENRPYYLNTGKPHREFGTRTIRSGEPLRLCQEEGISVFAVNFGRPWERRDIGLRDIARESGGAVFDARSEAELKSVYAAIVNQIINEYYLSYRATMEPAEKKYIRVKFTDNDSGTENARYYFSSTVFGLPLKGFSPWLLLPLLLSLVLAWILSRIDFENRNKNPSLEVLSPGPARSVTKMVTLNRGGKTIIGGATSADMTIAGSPATVKEHHATIVFDERKKSYTIVGDGDITVNNRPVKKRTLESGDVINVGGATIVFDEGVE